MLPLLPSITGIDPIQSMTFSTFYPMRQCLLKGAPIGALRFSPTVPRLPISRREIAGVVHHDLLEKLRLLRHAPADKKLTQALAVFDRIIAEVTREFIDSPSVRGTSLKDWDEIVTVRRNFLALVKDRTEPASCGRNFSVATEKRLVSEDGKLSGIVDALIKSDEQLILVEHKSGPVLQGGEIRERYLLQTLFYAQLIREATGVYPSKIVLKGSEKTPTVCELDSRAAQLVGRDARVYLAFFNSKAVKNSPVTKVATPGPITCGDCRYQPYCLAFWERGCDTGPANVHTYWLQEQELIAGASTHRTCLKGRIVKGRCAGREFFINDFYPARFDGYQFSAGSELVATGIRTTNDMSHACFTECSQLYRPA